MQHPLLPLFGDRDTLKLTVADDNSIIVAGGDAGAELLAVSRLEVLFGNGEDIGRGVQTQKLRRPLFNQVIGHHKHGLVAKAEAFALHRRRDHFEGLACTDFVGKERVAAIQNVRNSIQLMLTELYLRIHTGECNMLAVVLTRTGGIEKLVILLNQIVPPHRVFPYPFLKSILDGLLLLLGKRGFFGVEHALLFTIRIRDRVVNAHVAQIQRVLQNLVGIGAFRAVGHIGVDVAAAYNTLTGDIPFRAEIRVVDVNTPAHIESRLQQLEHKLPDIRFIDPRCAEAHFNFRSVQILWLRLPQRFYIG